MNFDRDDEGAMKAGSGQLVPGKHVGVIVLAKKVVSSNHNIGIRIEFHTDTGAKFNYLDLYAANPEGDWLAGYNKIQAIRSILRLDSLAMSQMVINEYNKNAGKEVAVTANVYRDLHGKRIGFLLQRNLYTKQGGGDGVSFNIYCPFEPDTELTAAELLQGITEPVEIERMLQNMEDRDSRKTPTKAPPSASQSSQPSSTSQPASRHMYDNASALSRGAGNDDDIPF